MRTVNIHETKTHLSRLVEHAAKGEPFVIAKAGKPLVKVSALDAPSGGQSRRLGFMADQIAVPDDLIGWAMPKLRDCLAMTGREIAVGSASAVMGSRPTGSTAWRCPRVARLSRQRVGVSAAKASPC
jgi:antitoxin (DNA-binding transcriptional repressor) of toxin-antitoxin stability system